MEWEEMNRKRMLPTYEEAPNYQSTNDTYSLRVSRDGLSKSSDDDDHEFETICSLNKRMKEVTVRPSNIHIFLRPTTSANQPKSNWPKKVPTGVATLTPRLCAELREEPKVKLVRKYKEMMRKRPTCGMTVDITQHGGSDVDSKDVVSRDMLL